MEFKFQSGANTKLVERREREQPANGAPTTAQTSRGDRCRPEVGRHQEAIVELELEKHGKKTCHFARSRRITLARWLARQLHSYTATLLYDWRATIRAKAYCRSLDLSHSRPQYMAGVPLPLVLLRSSSSRSSSRWRGEQWKSITI